jgi:hypothetical protein
MRLVYATAFALAAALVVAPIYGAAGQMDADRVVPGGGISAPGWKGKIIDASSLKQGRTINDSKFAKEGDSLQLSIGPAAIYWNPANTAKGDYTVKATFTEPKYMSANSHPHPYGIFIGGNKLDTDTPSLVYCSPYGNGTFIVRGFGPAPFQMGGRPPAASPAVHKAEQGGSVTQEVQWTVKGSRVECSINGTMVAGYDKSEVVGPGKLESTDGIAGIRVSHNVDVTVSGFAIGK